MWILLFSPNVCSPSFSRLCRENLFCKITHHHKQMYVFCFYRKVEAEWAKTKPHGIITWFWKIIKNKSVVNYLSISNGSGSCEQLCHVFKNLIEVINVPYTVLCCCKERKQEHETINQVDKTITCTLTSHLSTVQLIWVDLIINFSQFRFPRNQQRQIQKNIKKR